MALKTVYTSADDIPEAHKDLYAEAADGRFVLDLEDLDSHPQVRGVITANKENAKKAQDRLALLDAANKKLAALPEDFDPEAWSRFKSGAKPADDEQLNAIRAQHTKAVDQLKAQHQAALDEITAQVAERDGYIDGQARRDALNAALDEAGFDPIHKPMLSKFLEGQIKVKHEADGKRVAFADTDLGELAPLDFVKDFAKKQGQAYLAKPSGPGAPGNNGTSHRATSNGDFGGSKADRQKAIAKQFPELPSR